DASFGIDEVVGGPEAVLEGAPDRVVVVDRDGILDLKIRCGLADVRHSFLEGKLRRVHADDDETLVTVLRVPRAHIGNCSETVDARVSPEVDEDDLPLE